MSTGWSADYNQQPATPQLKSTRLQGPRLARFGVTGAIPSAPTHLSSYPLTAPITLRTPASSPPSMSWGTFPLTAVSCGLFCLDTKHLPPYPILTQKGVLITELCDCCHESAQDIERGPTSYARSEEKLFDYSATLRMRRTNHECCSGYSS